MARLASARLLGGIGLATALLGTGCENLSPESTLYGTVDVRVQRRNGAPVPNAPLVLYTGQRPMGYGTTDSTGRHVFTLVPEGLYGVRLGSLSGYLRAEELLGGSATDYVHNLRLKPRTTLDEQFTVIKVGKGSLSASIADSSGTPLAGVPVQLYSQAVKIDRTSDATGTVTFADLPTGNYGVVATTPAKYRDVQEPLYVYRDGLLVEPDIPSTTRFVFVACEGSIAVTLRDNLGAVVPRSKLFLYVSEGTVDSLVTPENGTGTFSNLACRDYGVRVRAPMGYVAEERTGSAFTDGLTVHKRSALTATLTIRSCKATLRVRTGDASATAVGGAKVTLYTSDENVRELLTGNDGRATFDGISCNVDYGVRVTPPPGFIVAQGRGLSFYDGVRLAEGQSDERSFTLNACRADVRVRVQDAASAPVAGGKITLYTADSVYAVMNSVADGTALFGNLPCNWEYGVTITPPTGFTVAAGKGSSYFDGIQLTNGITIERTFVVKPASANYR